MSKVMLALGSFVIGAICGSMSPSFIHTSTWAQAQSPQEPSLPSSTIQNLSAVPVVPPIWYFGKGDSIGGAAQQLDGFSCEGCTVTTPLLIYGGGSYSLSNTKFPKDVEVRLVGAAENTFKFLIFTGAIPAPAPPQPALPPDRTFKAEVRIKAKPNAVTLISTAGVKK